MKKTANQIDFYIHNAADFAKPILEYFRHLVHEVCPEVEEKIKWGFPHYDYKGSMMCSMASFKQHCSIGFWKAALMKQSKKLVAKAKTEEAMGHLGKITSLKDLPKVNILKAYIKDAMRLNDEGVKLSPRKKPANPAVIKAPDYFQKALSKNLNARQNFEAFAPSHKKEYILWITEAKTEATRNKRMQTALEWISEGKGRHWKYERKK